jgi:hypothetical protein
MARSLTSIKVMWEYSGESGRLQRRRGCGHRSFLYESIAHAFLPDGYPHSVSSAYTKFAAWQFAQGICSSAVAVLSTQVRHEYAIVYHRLTRFQCMLVSVGVGHEYFALGGAAAISWILKDGLGMVGKVLFASKYAHLLDVNPMKWRLVGDLTHNVGAGLELCTLLFPHHFLLIAAVANTAKASHT